MTLHFDLELERDGFRLEAAATVDEPTCGLFGASGSGKSSLLHLLAGLERPRRGRVVLDGRCLCDTAAGTWVPPHERGVALVFQDDQLFPHLDVRGNLRYGAARPGPAGGARLAEGEVVELLELGPHLAKRPRELSGGERKRVALGRALLSAPRLLLLDEPLSGLDQPLKQQILPYLARVREATAAPLVYVSHALDEILQLTDRLLLLERGALVGDGRLLDLVRERATLTRLLHRGLTNVLALFVADSDAASGLTILGREPGERWIKGPPLAPPGAPGADPVADPVGARVHLALRPEDVTIALGPVERISARNQLPGTVEELLPEDRRVLVRVDVGLPLLVEVSPSAVADLALAPGTPVWCLFKSNALEVLDAPRSEREPSKAVRTSDR